MQSFCSLIQKLQFEVDFVAFNNNGRMYVQVCETLRDSNNKILERELNSLRKIGITMRN